MLAMNLKTELMAAGFNNRVFMQGAISTYDGDMDKIGEYVAELKADESNAAFLGQTQAQPAPSPPNMPSVTRSNVSDKQIVALEKSSNPEDRQKAREYLEQRLRQGLPLP